ncbi:hypothetical protein VPH35_063107 [Triticum aestivum]|uniref:zinc finger protein ZAT9-like n=1 Tax=Triticum aestivum TaxID=4565 RepID=UPI001D02EB2E|nr:zinc finger protein ZAT9-like [Triticum aestivum]
MAGSAGDRLGQSGRRRREIKEGEVVASGYYTGSDTDTDDEDARYYLHPLPLHDHRDRQRMVTVARPGPAPVPVVEDVVGGSGSAGSRSRTRRSRSTTRRSSPSSSLGSDGTISDDGHASGDTAAVTALFPACPVCHRQFHSSKAVHGHMRVHAQAQPKEEERVSATVNAVDDTVSVSIAYVAAEPKTSDDPMTVELASSSSEPSQSAADLSMAIVVVEAAPPAAEPKKVDIAPTPPAPEQKEVPVPAPVAPAPEPAAVYLHPSAPAHQHVAVAPPQVFHGPLRIIQHQDPGAPRGFSCKECNRWFETHQGLGGHAAGHKNRRIAAAAAAAIAAGVDPIAAGGPRPEKLHTCKVCGEVYTSGVRLGGHMRKHYTGKPIVPRKRTRLLLPPDVVGLAIPGPAVVALVAEAAAQPPQAPVVPAGCLRLFGVTIMQQAKEEEKPQSPVDDKQ